MAVPKRRMSRANTRTRRSQWKAHNPALMETSECKYAATFLAVSGTNID